MEPLSTHMSIRERVAARWSIKTPERTGKDLQVFLPGRSSQTGNMELGPKNHTQHGFLGLNSIEPQTAEYEHLCESLPLHQKHESPLSSGFLAPRRPYLSWLWDQKPHIPRTWTRKVSVLPPPRNEKFNRVCSQGPKPKKFSRWLRGGIEPNHTCPGPTV